MSETLASRYGFRPAKVDSSIALCERACEIVETLGFVNVGRSKKSEATYWQYPGRDGVLRIAAHKNTWQTYNDQWIAASLVFHGAFKDGGKIKLTHTTADNQIYLALGMYMVRSKLKSLTVGRN